MGKRLWEKTCLQTRDLYRGKYLFFYYARKVNKGFTQEKGFTKEKTNFALL